jgi:DNA polymerase III epsilon subunit-like protein
MENILGGISNVFDIPMPEISVSLKGTEITTINKIVVIDVESTGVNTLSDQVLQVYAAQIDIDNAGRLSIGQTFNEMFDCWREIPAEASAINHIYKRRGDAAVDLPHYKYVEGNPLFDQEKRQVLIDMIGTRHILGYNIAKFDLPILRIESDKVIDLFKICPRLFTGNRKDKDNMKLDTCCRRMGISWDNSAGHDAEYDSMKTVELFMALASPECQARIVAREEEISREAANLPPLCRMIAESSPNSLWVKTEKRIDKDLLPGHPFHDGLIKRSSYTVRPVCFAPAKWAYSVVPGVCQHLTEGSFYLSVVSGGMADPSEYLDTQGNVYPKDKVKPYLKPSGSLGGKPYVLKLENITEWKVTG